MDELGAIRKAVPKIFKTKDVQVLYPGDVSSIRRLTSDELWYLAWEMRAQKMHWPVEAFCASDGTKILIHTSLYRSLRLKCEGKPIMSLEMAFRNCDFKNPSQLLDFVREHRNIEVVDIQEPSGCTRTYIVCATFLKKMVNHLITFLKQGDFPDITEVLLRFKKFHPRLHDAWMCCWPDVTIESTVEVLCSGSKGKIIMVGINLMLASSQRRQVKEYLKYEEGRTATHPVAAVVTGSNSTATVSPSSTCCVCLEKEAKCVIVPCGHKCVCQECGDRLTLCPCCRVEITHVIQVFNV